MNQVDDNLNKAIEDSLRLAHQQVQCRPAWATHVLSKISQELEQNSSVDRPLEPLQPVRASPKRTWSKVTALATGLAVGLLLVVLGSVFLARSMNSSRSNDAAKSIANNPAHRLPIDIAPRDGTQSNNAQAEHQSVKSEELQQDSFEPDDSVTAGTGYLATKLSSEAEFEIYVVLPTMPINVAGNTK